MINQSDIENAVRKTVLLFNRLKTPEAIAKVVFIMPEQVTISFSGSLCYECGDVEKYVDDFAHDFRVFIDYVRLEAGKVRETAHHSFEVDYRVIPR